MAKIEKRKGALNDPDAVFVCVGHEYTAALIGHLRKEKVKFTVDVEPEPHEDQSDDDIFWFESSADIPRIQALIYDIMPKQPNTEQGSGGNG